MDAIAFNVQLTADDYAAAVDWHSRHSTFMGKHGIAFNVAFACVAGALGATSSALLAAIEFVFVLVTTNLMTWVARQYWVPRRARRTFAQYRPLQDAHRYEFSDEGVKSSGAVGEAKFPWSYFKKYLESPDLFLLYMSDSAFLIIPERYVPSHDVFREMLRQCVGRPSATITGIS